MIVRDKERIARFKSMLRAAVKHPCLLAAFPAVGLAEVWGYDGKAYIFPGFGGLVVCDWFAAMRYVRRHLRRSKLNVQRHDDPSNQAYPPQRLPAH